jgi:hypothetical protein
VRERAMTIFVAEIGGRAIVLFEAENEIEARTIRDNFRDDFIVLGLCVEDTEIFAREAFEDEQAKWQATHPRPLMKEEIENGVRLLPVYLIPVVDPTDPDID